MVYAKYSFPLRMRMWRLPLPYGEENLLIRDAVRNVGSMAEKPSEEFLLLSLCFLLGTTHISKMVQAEK
jgi:hypothetical protein